MKRIQEINGETIRYLGGPEATLPRTVAQMQIAHPERKYEIVDVAAERNIRDDEQRAVVTAIEGEQFDGDEDDDADDADSWNGSRYSR
jgi:hypothetical protein